MGSGKTTLGKLLAKKSQATFYDTDKIIESSCGFNIPEIIKRFGVDYFRNLEHQVLSNLVSGRILFDSPFVLATGGGVVLNPNNKPLLNSLGVIYWLKASPTYIWQRVSRRLSRRPLLFNSLDPQAEVERLLHERQPLYQEFSDHILDTDGSSFNDLLLFF